MVRWVAVHPGPEFSVADVWTGWTEALRELGQHVFEYNLGDRLVFYDAAHLHLADDTYRKAIADDDEVVDLALNGLAAMLWKIRPRILLLVCGFFYDAELLEHARRAYGTRVVILHTESPYEDDRQLQAAPYADLNLVNDPVSVAKFAMLAPSVYCPHAYRPAVHRPGPPDRALACDLGFTGTGFPSRIGFLEQMNLAGLDVTLLGNWMSTPKESPLWQYLTGDGNISTPNAGVAGLYRSMRAGINLYRREASFPELVEGHGCGPREIEMAACGAFFLRDPRPESDALFPMLPSFSSPEEASDLLRWWLAHGDQRRDAALKAAEAVADRTFTNHAAQVLRLLGIQK